MYVELNTFSKQLNKCEIFCVAYLELILCFISAAVQGRSRPRYLSSDSGEGEEDLEERPDMADTGDTDMLLREL